MPATLTIGDFARATHLSVKALRHYHRIGLLVPAEIDRESGYRYYATEQIATAHIIRRFRDLDMPLDEIADVVSTDDLEARNRLISRHLDRLEESAQRDPVRGAVAPRPARLVDAGVDRAAQRRRHPCRGDHRDRRRGRARVRGSVARSASSTPRSRRPVSGRRAGGGPVRHRRVRPRPRRGNGVRAGRPRRSTRSAGSESSRSRPPTSP